MTHTRIALIIGLLALVVGLVSGLFLSLEIMFPGLGEEANFDRARDAYSKSVMLHGISMGFVLPLSLCGGLSCFLLGEKMSGHWLSYLYIIVGYVLLAAIGLALYLPAEVQNYVAHLTRFAAALTSVIFALLLVILHTARSVSAMLYLGLTIIGGALYWLVRQVMLHTGIDSALFDTHYVTTGLHALGLVVTLSVFAVLSVWATSRGARLSTWVSFTHAAALAGLTWLFARTHGTLGLMGMPRRYADYPEAFSTHTFVLAWLGISLMAVIALGVLRLCYAVWTRDRSTAADLF